MKIINENEIKEIMNFYYDVIDNTPDIEVYAKWKKDLHPAEDVVMSYIRQKAMYALVHGDTIVGAMAVTMSQDEDYHAISWEQDLNDDEVAVVHVLAAAPSAKGLGIGKKLVEEAIDLARAKGKKAVRLDALSCNVPAQHLYEEKGFKYRGWQKLYAGNTGWIDFWYYELML